MCNANENVYKSDQKLKLDNLSLNLLYSLDVYNSL